MSERQKVCGMLLHAYYVRDPRVQRAAHALRDAGWLVKVICLNEGDEAPREEIDGVQVIRCNLSRHRVRSKLNYVLEYGGFMLRSFFKLWREDRRQRHDLVVVHNMPNALVFSSLPLRVRGCPVILDMHDAAPEVFESLFGIKSKLFAKIVRLEETLAMKYASALITVNRGVESVFRERHPWAEFLLVHNSPASRHVSSGTAEPFDTSGVFCMVFHGHLHERYGLQRLIEILPELKSRGIAFTLDVHGDGPYFNALVELARETGFSEEVSFHGAFRPDELGELLKGKHLGFALHFPDDLGDLLLPVKILEYTQAGIPVAASRLATVLAYFPDGCISYFDDGTDLLEIILDTYRDYASALQRAQAARRISESISWDKDSKKLVDFAESVCGTR